MIVEAKAKIETHLEFKIATVKASFEPICLQALPSVESNFRSFSSSIHTVFENHRKSRIKHCERSELRSILIGQKFIINAKNGHFGELLKT